MYTITKEFTFETAHQPIGLQPSHQCSRLHGHGYRVVVVLQTYQLDEHSFVVDYGHLKPFKEYIDQHLDHRNLKDVLPVATTVENIAKFLYSGCKARWPQTVAVRVSETQKTWAEYRPDALLD